MKRPIVLSLFCHKGGVGKTSSTVGLADALVKNNPQARILIVDADEQSNVKTIFAIKLSEVEGGLASILLDDVSPESAKVKVRDRIDVILSGGRRMREFERQHANTPNAEVMMRVRFKDVQDYDYIIIDTPPALSLISSNIVTYADYLIIPTSPDLLAIVGIKNTIYFVENMKEIFKGRAKIADVIGILPTMYDQRRNVDTTVVDDLERMAEQNLTMGGVVFSPIRSDIKVKTAQIKRKLLSEVFPSSKAAEDYRKLAADVVGLVREKEHGPQIELPKIVEHTRPPEVTA